MCFQIDKPHQRAASHAEKNRKHKQKQNHIQSQQGWAPKTVRFQVSPLPHRLIQNGIRDFGAGVRHPNRSPRKGRPVFRPYPLVGGCRPRSEGGAGGRKVPKIPGLSKYTYTDQRADVHVRMYVHVRRVHVQNECACAYMCVCVCVLMYVRFDV